MTHATQKAPDQQPLKKTKLPWFRGLWWSIWLAIFTAIIIYTAGTFLYIHYVITPTIQAEKDALMQEKENYLRDFRAFLKTQTAQYHQELEKWRENTPQGTPPPAFNYQERVKPFREARERTRSGNNQKSENPINPWLWLLSMSLIIAAAIYPAARGLTRRLEKLQQGVESFGTGDLNTRVEVSGHDEVALLAQSFNASADQIKHLIQQHKNLLAHVSHELRTPLARLRMSTELAAMQVPDVAHDLRTDIKELDELVGEILLASRLDAVPDLLRMSSFDAFALAAEEAARTRADLEGCSIEMQADETLVRRALRNLLTNAEKYAPHSKTLLDVFLEKTNDNPIEMVCFRVTDEGLGVSKEEQENIFTPFFRGQKTPPNIHGIGLGLSLVAQIARRHNGSIICKSNPEIQGCIFELRIPIRPIEEVKNQ
ncbi:MAG: HAMP domain-containing sensor histidine kinase [Saezia sp.]